MTQAIGIELAFRRIKDVVDSLKQDLEDWQMILYYSEPDDSRIAHWTYMRDRAEIALAATQKAMARVHELAYEQGVVSHLPAA